MAQSVDGKDEEFAYRTPSFLWFYTKLEGALAGVFGFLLIQSNLRDSPSIYFLLLGIILLCNSFFALFLLARVSVEGDVIHVTTNLAERTFHITEIHSAGQFNFLNLKFGYIRLKRGMFVFKYRCFIIRYCMLPFLVERHTEPVTSYLRERVGRDWQNVEK